MTAATIEREKERERKRWKSFVVVLLSLSLPTTKLSFFLSLFPSSKLCFCSQSLHQFLLHWAEPIPLLFPFSLSSPPFFVPITQNKAKKNWKSIISFPQFLDFKQIFIKSFLRDFFSLILHPSFFFSLNCRCQNHQSWPILILARGQKPLGARNGNCHTKKNLQINNYIDLRLK